MRLILICILLTIMACKEAPIVPNPPDPKDPEEPELPWGTTPLEPSEQRSGDPQTGYDYLVNGDYVGSGIPIQIFKTVYGDAPDNPLGRTGDNATIRYDFTAVDAPNGARVVAANCLQCHAQPLNGELIVGLGNSLSDFTEDQSELVPALDLAVQFIHGKPSTEWDAYAPFRRALLATGPHLKTPVAGVNPADQLASVLAAHRNPENLVWRETPGLDIAPAVVPTDVPAWWLLKKKNAMFYAAVGRGDFARIMMASSLLTLTDSAEARAVDNQFADVLSYILSLEAPTYPQAIDQTLADQGAALFAESCQACHGTYGPESEYPNLLVSLERVGTDSLLAESYYSGEDFLNWYNQSWFAKGSNNAKLQAGDGYIAPPLDGVWATAPYLHNGSVPTLEDLLNSSQRPIYWRRSFDDSDYDFEKVGWKYTTESSQTDKFTYDTSLPGYGNSGHTFADGFTDQERKAIIEYLKTL